jgi:thioredoxin-related protein
MKTKIQNGMFMGVFVAFMNTALLSACEINFTKAENLKDLELSIEAAKSNGKLIFIDVTADWCGWCTYMKTTTFLDETVSNYFNSFFINLQVEYESELFEYISKQHEISGLPAFLILNGDGELVGKYEGYQNAEELVIKAANTVEFSQKLDKARKNYKSDPKNNQFIRDYLLALASIGRIGEGRALVQEYFNRQYAVDYYADWDLVTTYFNEIADPRVVYIMEHSKLLKEQLGIDKVDDFLIKVFQVNMDSAVQAGNISLMNNCLAITGYLSDSLFTCYTRENFNNNIRLNFYEKTSNWDQYAILANQIVQQMNDYSIKDIFEYVVKFYYNVENSEYLSLAEKWIEPILDEDPEFYTYISYAIILYKNGKRKDGKTFFNKAKKLASGDNELEIVENLVAELGI